MENHVLVCRALKTFVLKDLKEVLPNLVVRNIAACHVLVVLKLELT